MRDYDKRVNGRTGEFIRPRYMVWENVIGCFSSNNGEDFRCVLQETINIIDSTTNVPGLPKGAQWSKSGVVLGDGWSIAWRVHDAQFWGVPQRRKRISLIADFGGQSAPEILFERKSEYRDLEQSQEKGQDTSTTIGDSIAETSESDVKSYGCDLKSGRISGNISPTLTTRSGNSATTGGQVLTVKEGCLNSWEVQSKHIQPSNGIAESLYSGETRYGGGESYVLDDTKVYGISAYDSNAMKSDNPNSGIYEADTARTLDLNGGNPACNQGGMAVVYTNYKADGATGNDIAFATVGDHENRPTDMTNLVVKQCSKDADSKLTFRKTGHPQNSEEGQGWEECNINDTLNVTDNSETRTPTLVVDQGAGKSQCNVSEEVTPTLTTTHGGEPVISCEVFHCSTEEEVAAPLKARDFKDPQIVKTQDVYGIDQQGGKGQGNYTINVAPTMASESHGTPHAVCYDKEQQKEHIYSLEGNGSRDSHKGDGYSESEVMYTLNTVEQHAVCCSGSETYQKTSGCLNASGYDKLGTQEATNDMYVANSSIVRRLTPLECTRLQGFYDHWCDIGDWYDTKGKLHKDSDSVKYKALGNSIALPFWKWMAKRMVSQYPSDYKPTMASLFDGIGGFPLSYYEAGCKPVWNSEIEEFPMAVTRKHFGDETTGEVGDLEKFYENK